MTNTLEELFDEGHRKVVCTDDGGFKWWTVGKVYTFNDNGVIYDDEGDECEDTDAEFEPYQAFGMTNKEFSDEDLDALAKVVAEKVCAIIKDELG